MYLWDSNGVAEQMEAEYIALKAERRRQVEQLFSLAGDVLVDLGEGSNGASVGREDCACRKDKLVEATPRKGSIKHQRAYDDAREAIIMQGEGETVGDHETSSPYARDLSLILGWANGLLVRGPCGGHKLGDFSPEDKQLYPTLVESFDQPFIWKNYNESTMGFYSPVDEFSKTDQVNLMIQALKQIDDNFDAITEWFDQYFISGLADKAQNIACMSSLFSGASRVVQGAVACKIFRLVPCESEAFGNTIGFKTLKQYARVMFKEKNITFINESYLDAMIKAYNENSHSKATQACIVMDMAALLVHEQFHICGYGHPLPNLLQAYYRTYTRDRISEQHEILGGYADATYCCAETLTCYNPDHWVHDDDEPEDSVSRVNVYLKQLDFPCNGDVSSGSDGYRPNCVLNYAGTDRECVQPTDSNHG